MTRTRSDRFVSTAVPTAAEFERHARQCGHKPVRARKTGLVAAKRAGKAQRVETHWNGLETSNEARPGDYIVTNLAEDGTPLRDADGKLNTYVIGPDRFSELYEPAGTKTKLGAIYRSIAIVDALRLEDGFDILAPWGERQRAGKGYLIRHGDEVYGNHADTFEATYETLPE